jgi:hypothetical protein
LSEISRRRQLHPPPVSWDFVLAAILLCPRTLHDFLLRQCFCSLRDFIMRLGASEKREKSVGARANFSFRPKKSPARKKALLPKMSYMCVGQFSQHRRRFY